MGKLTNLKKIKLEINGYGIQSEQNAINLIKSISKLDKLECLILYLWLPQFSD